jgi:hypothetical protein
MEYLKNIIIKKVTVKGFKFFKEETDFELGSQLTSIYSDNGTGKTSLQDAIVWAFIGTDKMGETRDSYLKNSKCKSMRVSVVFEDENRIQHKLIRKKSGNRLSILYDDLPMTQAQMEYMCYTKHIFLSIVNPEYFVVWSSENKNDARNLIYGILPAVPQEKILERLDSQYGELLAGKNLSDISLFIKQKRAELREYDKDELHITGQYDALTRLVNDNANNNLDLSTIGTEISRLNQLLNQYSNNADIINNQLENLIREKSNLFEEKSLLYKDEAIDKLKNELLIKNNQMQIYHKTYTDMAKEANKLKPGLKCNSCQQIIAKEHVAKIHTTTGKKLKDITVAAKELANETETIKKKLLISEKENADKIRKLDEEIIKIDKELNTVKNASLKTKQENEAKKKNILAKILQLQEKKSSMNKEADAKKEIKKIQKMHQETKDNIAQTENIIKAAIEYSYQKSELLMSELNGKMKHTEIKLQEVVKSTGELKECFKLTYDSRNTILLSTSERIKMGAEISKLLRETLNIDYFMVLDNAESITEFEPIATQTIAAFVRKGSNLNIAA